MFGQAGHTEFDVRFQLFGIPVRIHPMFWLTSALLVWNPHQPAALIVGIGAVLISVLVHELGHAVLLRKYGHPSEIVLYIFGGYATATRLSTWKNVRVLFAGPGAGLCLFALTYGVFRLVDNVRPEWLDPTHLFSHFLQLMLFMNLMWSVINLIPVVPLDGGRIVETLLHHYRPRQAWILLPRIYIVASAGVALWSLYCMKNPHLNVIPIPSAVLPRLSIRAIQPDPKMLAIMFGLLCVMHIQSYNQLRNRY